MRNQKTCLKRQRGAPAITRELIPASQPFSASAFTLIELLIVISIIIILLGLLFPAFRGVQEQATKAQAKNDLTQIVTAATAFYAEYGRYPVTATTAPNDAFFGTGTAPTGTSSVGTNELLFDVLRNNTGGANTATLNPRQVVFFSPPNVKNTAQPRSGIGSDSRYYDPWGSPYNVVIDTNYDSQITNNPYTDTASAGGAPIRVGVIAYSFGKNGKLGGGTRASTSFADESGSAGNYKDSGDVISWQ